MKQNIEILLLPEKLALLISKIVSKESLKQYANEVIFPISFQGAIKRCTNV